MRKVNLGTRVAPEMVERVDRIAEAMMKATPGLDLSRSDAARVALERGVDALEREFGLAGEAPPALKGGKPARKPKP